MLRRLAFACALLVTLTACGDDGDGGDDGEALPQPSATATTAPVVTTTESPPSTSGPASTAVPEPTPEPPPAPQGQFDTVSIRLTEVASVEQPVAMVARPGDDILYVAEKTGRVRPLRSGAVGAPVLDLSGQVSDGFEQGLLGIVFSPDGGRLYVNYTDRAGDTHVVEYQFSNGAADTGSRRELLAVDQPFANHNGGNLVFGPDGNLWIGLGDGGSGGDPMGNAQSLGTLLGKMLRIDPSPSGDRPYRIPAENPFVDEPGARPEIWSFGLRNPWRYSFDRATGDLWIGDVGQNAVEEIDFQPAGRSGDNYGWDRLEGTRRFEGSPPADAVSPVHEYGREGGACSVTAGYVYRGSRIPGLVGAFVYADYCVGDVRALWQSGGSVSADRSLGVTVEQLSSFAEDAAGDLYALSLEGPIYRLDPA